MLRATREMQTRDIETIVKRYRGRNFGFASRNFYTSFLAALEVDRNAAKYFGQVQPAEPLNYDTAVTTHYIPAATLARTAGVELEVLRRYNPSLLEPVWTGEKHIPKGFQIRLPQDQRPVALRQPTSAGKPTQAADTCVIQRGDSLRQIARRFNLSQEDLAAWNDLTHTHRIKPGQVLRLASVD